MANHIMILETMIFLHNSSCMSKEGFLLVGHKMVPFGLLQDSPVELLGERLIVNVHLFQQMLRIVMIRSLFSSHRIRDCAPVSDG